VAADWLVAGYLPAVLAFLAVCSAVFGFPIYFWVKDRRRRGQGIGFLGLLSAAFVGLIGIAAICLFLVAKGC